MVVVEVSYIVRNPLFWAHHFEWHNSNEKTTFLNMVFFFFWDSIGKDANITTLIIDLHVSLKQVKWAYQIKS